jgi:large subunit ribosomal protein L25
MADAGELEITVREKAGTGASRAVRRSGQIPGILYGGGDAPLLISMNDRAIRQAMHTPNFFSKPIQLKLDGKKLQALPREVQVHPVTEVPVHVDFMRVKADSKIRINVPARFINEAASPGLKRGGVLNIVRHEIEVVCSVSAIPEYFEFDLTDLDIGDSVHISRLTLPPGVKLTITGRDFTVASVAAPTVQAIEEVKPAEAAVAAEGEGPAAVPTTEQGPPPEAAPAAEGKEKKEKKK